jgi:hypothetical protein
MVVVGRDVARLPKWAEHWRRHSPRWPRRWTCRSPSQATSRRRIFAEGAFCRQMDQPTKAGAMKLGIDMIVDYLN